jgi:hypothetical protein
MPFKRVNEIIQQYAGDQGYFLMGYLSHLSLRLIAQLNCDGNFPSELDKAQERKEGPD